MGSVPFACGVRRLKSPYDYWGRYTQSKRNPFKALRDGAGTGDAAAEGGLTSREREILVSFAQGMSYTRIAEARGIKPVTARNAIYGIQQKLSVGTMQELVLWCVHNGLLDDYTTDGFRGHTPPDNL